MTSFTTMTMPHIQKRKRAMELARDLSEPLSQIADRSVHAKHIVVTRSKFASAISTQGHNVRLEIWLAGWHIAIYDESGEQPRGIGAR
jgi:transcription antitermination factor NusA-like protein